MRDCVRYSGHVAKAALFGVSLAALTAPAGAAEYKMTVNQDRLIHADREPQNWLMMNGDYGSHPLFQALPDQSRQRQEPAHGVGAGAARHAGHRPERSGERSQSADRQRLHVYQRRLGHGLQDRRALGRPRRVRVDRRSRRQARGQHPAHPRHRAVGRPRHQQSPRRPRHRDQPRQRRDRMGQAGRQAERVRHQGADELGAAGCARARSSSPTAPATAVPAAGLPPSTPGPATSCGAGTRSRSPASPAARPGRTRTTPGRPAAAGYGRRAPTIPKPSSPSGAPATRSRNTIRHHARATTSTPTRSLRVDVNTGKLQWYFQYLPNDSWDYDEIGVHMLYNVNIGGEPRKVVSHFARNGFFYSLDRNNGSFVKGAQYVNDLNWTKGLDPKTGKPIEYDPKLDVQTYVAAARPMPRRSDEALVPDLARRRRLSAHGLQSGQADCLRRRSRGLLELERLHRGVQGTGRRPRSGEVQQADLQQRSLLRLDHRLRRGQPEGAGEGRDGHRDPFRCDRHRRRRAVLRPAGRLGRRL